MAKKIPTEIRQKIISLSQEGKSAKDIHEIIQQEQEISIKSVYRIIKEGKENVNTTFYSSGSCDDLFPSFPIIVKKEEEPLLCEKDDTETIINEIKNAVKEETVKILREVNQPSDKEDQFDQILKETKKKCKPMNFSSNEVKVNPLDTDNLSDQEKEIRRNLMTKIRNYIDSFADHEVIQEICGCASQSSEEGRMAIFKHRLCEKDIKTLNLIYEEIQIGLNRSKEYEHFINLFSTSLKCIEFVSNIFTGINIAGFRDDILNEIDEFDLKQLACELSVSRYVSPQRRIILISLKVLLKKILSSDLIGKHQDLKVKLYGYYQSLCSFIGR